MQKKLIALAVAGLVSAPAFAQSNVTIYGIADVGFGHRSDNVASGVSSQKAINSGQLSGSRLGFRGTEDLGNGLKASFVIEQGINLDDGTSGQGRTFGRQSYVALSGNFGTVAAGRQYTPQHLLMAAIDPFGQGTVGENVNIWGLGSAASYPTRLNNLAAYISPTFGGFNVVAGWTWAANQQESVENKSTLGPVTCTTATPPVCTQTAVNDLRVWAVNPNYVNGPIRVGLNYHNARFQNGAGANARAKVQVWDLAGAYDFGVVKLAAAYGVDNPSGSDNNTKKYMVGVTVPVGAAGNVLASYNRAKHEDGDRASQWAVGYTHALSKRTTLYTAYSDINNRTATTEVFTASVGDAANAGQGYQRGFNLGVRHSF